VRKEDIEMVIYRNTYKQFKRDVAHLELTDILIKKFDTILHRKVADSEKRSFENSLSAMYRVMNTTSLPDDCGVSIEYNLPHTNRRIDFIIAGKDEKNKKNVIIVELKQWESAIATQMDGVVQTFLNKGIRNTSHPSYQAFGYKKFLQDFNEAVYDGDIEVQSCAFLHNYSANDPEPLLDEIYTHYIDDTPLFFREHVDPLVTFISTHVGKGKGMDILYEIENGKIRPSVILVDAVGSLFKGNKFFLLLDEQKVLYETLIHTPLLDRKQVVIIQGGPGTGKSVLSFNLLYGMLRKRKNVVLAAPNASFREVMKQKLKESGMKKSSRDPSDTMVLDNIVTGSAGYFKIPKNQYDVIIVDEAHRLKDDKAYQYKGENQIRDVINASRLSIFFVDDLQSIRPEDIGSVNNIKQVATSFNAKTSEYVLEVQFRCSGMDGYINWVDHTLNIKDTANFDSWDNEAFTLTLCDSPHEVYENVTHRIKEGCEARMLAGYAWKWTSAKEGNPDGQIEDVVIEEHNFKMPWNSRSARTTWAIDATGVNQIGCIHTSQGLEFDYVGIIIGKDLQYDPVKKELFASWDNYKDAAGKKGLKGNTYKLTQLVKNIYKVLLTRAMKGCYVYCHDVNLQEYIRLCLPKQKSYSIDLPSIMGVAERYEYEPDS